MVSFREYVEALLNERELRYEQRHRSTQEALNAAKSATEQAMQTAFKEMERRLESLNHLRSDVDHDRATYLRTDVYTSHHESLIIQVTRVQKELGDKVTGVQKELGDIRDDVTAIKTKSSTWILATGAGDVSPIFRRPREARH